MFNNSTVFGYILGCSCSHYTNSYLEGKMVKNKLVNEEKMDRVLVACARVTRMFLDSNKSSHQLSWFWTTGYQFVRSQYNDLCRAHFLLLCALNVYLIWLAF